MKFGVHLPVFAEFGDPLVLVDLALKAEEAGWEGFFLWDNMLFAPVALPISDAWLTLAAVAVKTERIRLGPMITPLARRRAWKVAREAVTLDYLSSGRAHLGVGLGDPAEWDFRFFGEESDDRVRAKILDEGLETITGLWKGNPFSYRGRHNRLEEMTFWPVPIQEPRIPIWVGGNWPNRKPFRRAARYDGVYAGKAGETIEESVLNPDEWREIVSYISSIRTFDAPFDYVHGGTTPADNPARSTDIVGEYQEAGVTWWVEEIDPWRFGWDGSGDWPGAQMRERIEMGPPSL